MPEMTLTKGAACGRCSKSMPTKPGTITKGQSIKVVVNGIVMPAFFVGIDTKFGYCVRCQTYTPDPSLLPVQSQ